jgi:hypothetical protein
MDAALSRELKELADAPALLRLGLEAAYRGPNGS